LSEDERYRSGEEAMLAPVVQYLLPAAHYRASHLPIPATNYSMAKGDNIELMSADRKPPSDPQIQHK
jgi:hypothetical protein